jgi:hypothetical protein
MAECSCCGQKVNVSTIKVQDREVVVFSHQVGYIVENRRVVAIDWDTVCTDWIPISSNGLSLVKNDNWRRHGIAVFVG